MKENNIEEDIKILTDYMIELNKDIQDTEEWVNTGADEEKYYAIKNVLEYLEKLKKENNRLRYENCKLKTIRYTTDFGTESIHLIPESDLVKINTNRYMIEIENGRFVDLKQVYQENVKLKKENEELKKFHIQDNKHLDFIMKNSIPVEKVKDKIEKEIKYHEKNILDIENMTMLKGKTAKEEAEIEFNKYAIVVLKKMLQELLESEE